MPMQQQGMLAQLPRQTRRLAVAAVAPGSESGGAGAARIAFMRRCWANWGAPGSGSAGGGCKGAGGGPPFSAARRRLTCSSLAAALMLTHRWRRAGRAGSTGRPAAACKLTAAACIALPALKAESNEGWRRIGLSGGCRGRRSAAASSAAAEIRDHPEPGHRAVLLDSFKHSRK